MNLRFTHEKYVGISNKDRAQNIENAAISIITSVTAIRIQGTNADSGKQE